jgi:hypothetical protein
LKCSSSTRVRATVRGRAFSWRCPTLDVSIPRLLFRKALRNVSVFRTQYTSDIIVPCCMNSAICTNFLSRKTAAMSFLQDNVCSVIFCLFGECVCLHCFDCYLVSTFTNETQVSSPVAHTMWLGNPSPFLWHRSKQVKAETILCVLCAIVSIFGTHLAQNLW